MLDPHLAGLLSGWGQKQLPSASSRKWCSRITELQLISVHALAPGCSSLRPLNCTDKASVDHSICMPYGEGL